MDASQPTYELSRIIELIRASRYRTSGVAARGAGELGFDERDIVSCVCALTATEFYKTMEATQRPGFWQDVYRTQHGGISVYVKLQIEGVDPDEKTVIIQFKRL